MQQRPCRIPRARARGPWRLAGYSAFYPCRFRQCRRAGTGCYAVRRLPRALAAMLRSDSNPLLIICLSLTPTQARTIVGGWCGRVSDAKFERQKPRISPHSHRKAKCLRRTQTWPPCVLPVPSFLALRQCRDAAMGLSSKECLFPRARSRTRAFKGAPGRARDSGLNPSTRAGKLLH